MFEITWHVKSHIPICFPSICIHWYWFVSTFIRILWFCNLFNNLCNNLFWIPPCGIPRAQTQTFVMNCNTGILGQQKSSHKTSIRIDSKQKTVQEIAASLENRFPRPFPLCDLANTQKSGFFACYPAACYLWTLLKLCRRWAHEWDCGVNSDYLKIKRFTNCE